MTRNNASAAIAEKAGEYFLNGYHCAESVVAATVDYFPEIIDSKRKTAITCATCFGGGFGRSFDEACGVISGGLVVLGLLYGRSERGENWDIPAELADMYRGMFLSKHSTSHCGKLRERFGDEHQMQECQQLVCTGVIDLLQLIEQHQKEVDQQASSQE